MTYEMILKENCGETTNKFKKKTVHRTRLVKHGNGFHYGRRTEPKLRHK
jgi:hypothetical protein